jgi:hypothetical protein
MLHYSSTPSFVQLHQHLLVTTAAGFVVAAFRCHFLIIDYDDIIAATSGEYSRGRRDEMTAHHRMRKIVRQ